jgi:outer membrane receptor protein involved in Fe transport
LLGSVLAISVVFGQYKSITVSGQFKDQKTKETLAYINVVLKTEKDSAFVSGTVSDEEGRFSLSGIVPNNYVLEFSSIGYLTKKMPLFVGSLSEYLNLSVIELSDDSYAIEEVIITSKQDEVSGKMDKKVFSVEDNLSQAGGSVLQVMQNLPGVTVQDGKLQIRGNDKVTVLLDGKQTALTGFGNQSGLDNIPASAIEKIEIINNPSAKYDANGNAGIINIIYKKNVQEGFTGKAGLSVGAGALWVRKENLPTLSPQYQGTPKVNPSLSLNYRKSKVNAFFQGDYLYTHTLNKNEFITRTYDDGTIIHQQTKRNRNTGFLTLRSGADFTLNSNNTLTISGLYGLETILDHGEQPFFNQDYTERLRLWKFLEDEVKTTVMATASFQHKFKQPGHLLNAGFNYTFHREDEKYFFDNIYPSFTGKDAFKLISDEQVVDLNLDYIRPLKYGKVETGIKFRKRDIPTNMQFFPGINSPLDTNAGGWANYRELIPAVFGNYIYESKKLEGEIGVRLEYVDLKYEVNPEHVTYKSNGYSYTQPFPNMRLAWKLNDYNKISVFYNRRVDRPNEVDIRIFPKYDDAEIIKVGNPALKPQFTNTLEAGFKSSWSKGYVYGALYHKFADATITRIAVTVPGSYLIYAIFQNSGKSYNSGAEMVFSQTVNKWYSCTANLNVYRNQINAFSVTNYYPEISTYTSTQQDIISGTLKMNNQFHLNKLTDAQITILYQAPDIIPQGKTNARFSVDAGVKRSILKGKGEVFANGTDLFNTLIIRKEIQGQGFSYTATDYYETQVFRIGFNCKF